jgi:hypothetical protein
VCVCVCVYVHMCGFCACAHLCACVCAQNCSLVCLYNFQLWAKVLHRVWSLAAANLQEGISLLKMLFECYTLNTAVFNVYALLSLAAQPSF